MTVFTSSHFASSSAAGEDWREAAKKILGELEDVAKSRKESENAFNFGFLYLSDHLAKDAESVINLFRSVLNIEIWMGTTGIGVCGNAETHIDKPAISVLIGHADPRNFCTFSAQDIKGDPGMKNLEGWVENNTPMLVVTHGNPLSEKDPEVTLKELEEVSSGFLVGGLSSSRTNHVHFAGNEDSQDKDSDISGIAFSQDIKVATSLSQGCLPIGGLHVITRGDDHIIRELDSKKSTEVFEEDIKSMVIKKIDRDPDTIIVDEEVMENPETAPEELKHLFKGEIHSAFPVSGSDQQDYLVRNIIGMDPDEGAIVISKTVSTGENMLFVHRDDNTVQEDLSRSLVELRERVIKETGSFSPKGALYISCVARAFSKFDGKASNEMKLVHDIIGDVPLAGFYAGGEICSARLYGYTGILTLFL